jgi:hypothetical protein
VSRYLVTVGSDTHIVEIGQPEHPILLDCEHTGFQTADGSCRAADCIRLAMTRAYGHVYETEEEREAAGGACSWDELSYERVAS